MSLPTSRFIRPVALLLLTCLLPSAWADLLLAENGVAKAVIVVQADPDPATTAKQKKQPDTTWYRQALRIPAEDLKHYLDRITGADFALITDGDAIPAGIDLQIHVGQTQAALKSGVKFPRGFDPTIRPELFEEEGYAIASRSEAIFLVGNQNGPYRGTSYAVYDFLGRLGVRWLLPGEWGEVVPSTPTLRVPDLDVVERPDFAVRFINQGSWITYNAKERDEYHWFTIRNRMNPGLNGFPSTLYPTAGDGFLAMWLPDMFKEYPEYYAMSPMGERKGGSNRFSMLCLSNPDLLDVYTEALRKVVDSNSRWVSPLGVGISPPDGSPACYCPECKKDHINLNYPQYNHMPMISEPYYRFSAELAKRLPDKIIATMAYSSRIMPPQGVTLQPNNSVSIAPIEADSLHPINDPRAWRNQELYSIIKQFRAQTPHVTIYDYNPGLLLTNYIPEAESENIAVNIPILRELDVKGISSEGRKSHMTSWLSHYVTARLLWNSEEDLESIKDDFYGNLFGPASDDVRAWWDACAQRLIGSRIQAHEDWLLTNVYTLEFVDSIQPYVQAAREAATTEPYKSRVIAFSHIVDNLRGWAIMWDAEQSLDYERALEGAVMMEDAKAALHAISGHFNNPTTHQRNIFMCTGNLSRLKTRLLLTAGDKPLPASVAEDTIVSRTPFKGRKLADIPLSAKFAEDRFSQGVVAQWYASDFDDSAWGDHSTFFFIEQEADSFLDESGHQPDGIFWYRVTVDLPKTDKPVRLRLNGASNEAWVWVNGQFVQHREHGIWWKAPNLVDVDITAAVKAGTNHIAVRILDTDEVGGLYHRGFIYDVLSQEE